MNQRRVFYFHALSFKLEDAEFARTAAMKAKQNCELELADVHQQVRVVSVKSMS